MADSDSNICPSWLKPEIFEDLLKKEIPEYQKIIDFKVNPALSPGENYATLMLRVEIDLALKNDKQRTVKYVIKVPIENELFNSILKDRNMFHCEAKMYREVLPELEQMFRDAGVEVKFGATCYKLPVEENYVILEDLKPSGFQNVKRINGLDKTHLEVVLTKLAQWHAATATRIATKGKYEDLLTKSFFTKNQRSMLTTMLMGGVEPFLKSFVRKPGDEKYFEAVSKYYNSLVDELFKATVVDENQFNTLNHGDFWTNNIMFQYDNEGKIKQTYFVDYQVPCYGSPAQDLLYLLISSARYEIKIQLFDYFIKFYHDRLVEYLKLLKYPKTIPTLKDIHCAILHKSIWGVWSIVGTMAAVNLEKTEGANLDAFLSESDEGNSFKMEMFSNALFRKHVDIVLPWLYNRGALDCTK